MIHKFHNACANGLVQTVKDMLSTHDNSFDILNAENREGETSLQIACKGGHIETIKALLDYQIMNANYQGFKGINSNFFMSLVNDRDNVISQLMHVSDDHFRYVFMEGVIFNHHEKLKNFLDDKQNREHINKIITPHKESVFHYAIRMNQEEIVKVLLKYKETNVNIASDFGTPLITAAKHKFLGIMEILLHEPKVYKPPRRLFERYNDRISQEVYEAFSEYHQKRAKIFVQCKKFNLGYFRIINENEPGAKFFRLVSSLPAEIQMRVCNLACGFDADFIEGYWIMFVILVMKKKLE